MMKQGDGYEPNVVEDLSVLEGTEFMMLREGKVLFEGAARELHASPDPYIRGFLS
jgi:ABC-type transporter Mla maintaining outer membrane lipid asymmetry ATPase subunit MlaF